MLCPTASYLFWTCGISVFLFDADFGTFRNFWASPETFFFGWEAYRWPWREKAVAENRSCGMPRIFLWGLWGGGLKVGVEAWLVGWCFWWMWCMKKCPFFCCCLGLGFGPAKLSGPEYLGNIEGLVWRLFAWTLEQELHRAQRMCWPQAYQGCK